MARLYKDFGIMENHFHALESATPIITSCERESLYFQETQGTGNRQEGGMVFLSYIASGFLR
jgi:hypothetical protein